MRGVNDDYQELLKFISSYKIEHSGFGGEFNNALKKMHKRYYVFLALHHELMTEGGFISTLPLAQQEIFKYRIGEVLSELGTILFLSIHGCYKAAKLVMRSSLENFSKAIGCLVNANIVNEKSVYKVIEIALSHEVFNEKAKVEKNHINETYSKLCEDVHTASLKNMQHIDCIGSFPISDCKMFTLLSENFIRLINSFSSVLIKIEPNVFHKAQHTHKDLIALILSNEDKRMIHQLV